jgi:hypothetical protein
MLQKAGTESSEFASLKSERRRSDAHTSCIQIFLYLQMLQDFDRQNGC